MAHFHRMPDDRETSSDHLDPDDDKRHFHLVDGEKTSVVEFGDGHTHTLGGEVTSGPEEKSNNMNRETKALSGQIMEYKQEERNGVQVGIFEGYIATWDLDRGAWGVKDRFVRGAFLDSLADLRAKSRPIRLKDHHGRTVGGFPIETVIEDERGLFAVGEINLEVQQGREAFSLIKQRIITDMSIGFTSLSDSEITVDGDRIREITKAIVWEGSVVDEPMNPEANITEVKTVVPFQDLPLADRDTAWNPAEAKTRLNEAKANETEQKKAFLWSGEKSNLLQIADVIDGKLTAIPKAIFLAAANIEHEGSGIPADDLPAVKKNIEQYYEKMGIDSPFDSAPKKSYSVELTTRNVEKALRVYGFSKKEAKSISAQVTIDKPSKEIQNKSQVVANAFKSLVESIQNPA